MPPAPLPEEHPDEVRRKRTPEQTAKVKRLLSRLAIFAKESKALPDFRDIPHREMCDQMQRSNPKIRTGDTQDRCIYLGPRDSFKTSIEVCFMVWLVLYWFERGEFIKINYGRAVAKDAEDVLYEVKQIFETNEVILELWGNLKLISGIWAADQINISGDRDPTIATLGLDRGTAGKHIDIAILDDLVNETNFESPKVKRAARTRVKTYAPVLRPWGAILLSGTRFAFNDAYGEILDDNDRARREVERLENLLRLKSAAVTKRDIEAAQPMWREYVRAAVDERGQLFFPSRITHAYLAERKKALEGTNFYEAFFFNNPVEGGMDRFRLEYLKYFNCHYSRWPIPMLELTVDYDGRPVTTEAFPVRVTMCVDPTLTASGTSDWTGVSIVATDGYGNWWVLASLRYREVPSVVAERIVALIRRYEPSVCRIESAMADVEMVARIQRAIVTERLTTSIQSYNPMRDEQHRTGRRKKSARIEALQPRFAAGTIALQRDACDALYDQYRHWPGVDHDDVFDALAMQIGLAKPCDWKTVEEANFQRLEEDDEERGSLYAAYRETDSSPSRGAHAGLSGGSRKAGLRPSSLAAR